MQNPRRPQSPPSRQQGFTLIEMVVTLAILIQVGRFFNQQCFTG